MGVHHLQAYFLFPGVLHSLSFNVSAFCISSEHVRVLCRSPLLFSRRRESTCGHYPTSYQYIHLSSRRREGNCSWHLSFLNLHSVCVGGCVAKLSLARRRHCLFDARRKK